MVSGVLEVGLYRRKECFGFATKAVVMEWQVGWLVDGGNSDDAESEKRSRVRSLWGARSLEIGSKKVLLPSVVYR